MSSDSWGRVSRTHESATPKPWSADFFGGPADGTSRVVELRTRDSWSALIIPWAISWEPPVSVSADSVAANAHCYAALHRYILISEERSKFLYAHQCGERCSWPGFDFDLLGHADPVRVLRDWVDRTCRGVLMVDAHVVYG